MNNLTAQATITIDAPIETVWEALTDPALVKQYFFGVNLETTWEVGGPIIYRGEWQGKTFEDRGTVLEIVRPTRLVTNYWSAALGPDTPENRQTVTYLLDEQAGRTTVTIQQEGSKTSEAKEHSEGNWQMVLAEMKKIVEAA